MSTKLITAIVVVALLGSVAAFNYFIGMDPVQLAARGVGSGGGCGHDACGDDHDEDCSEPEMTLDEYVEGITVPIGSEDAEVLVQKLFDDPELLEDMFIPMFTAIEREYPGHVRFEFIPFYTDEAKQLTETITGGRDVGLIINDEMIKMVPDAPLGMLSFGGSPVFEEWSERDLRMAIEWELKQVGVDVDAIETAAAPPEHEHDHDHATCCPH